MKYFAGLDVSLEETAICVVDETGQILKEARAASEPEALDALFSTLGLPLERLGLEACSLTAWLHGELKAAGWPAICIEFATRQGGHGRHAEQDRPQRCARYRANHADRMVPRGARKDNDMSFLAFAPDRAPNGSQ